MSQNTFISQLYLKILKRILDESFFGKMEMEERLVNGLILIQSGPFPKENNFLKEILLSRNFSSFNEKLQLLPETFLSLTRNSEVSDFFKNELKNHKTKKNRALRILKSVIKGLESTYANSEIDLRLRKLQGLIKCSDLDLDGIVALALLKMLGSSMNKMPLFSREYREYDRFQERVFKKEHIITLLGLPKSHISLLFPQDGVVVQGKLIEHGRFSMLSLSEQVFNYLTVEDYGDVNNILQLDERDDSETYPLESFSIGGEELEMAQGLLRTKSRTIILIEGVPGSGKTEFSRSIVKSVGKRCLWIPSCKATDGDEAVKKRKSIFQLSTLVCNPSDMVVVFDEADEILSSKMDNAFRFLNPSLTSNKDMLNGILDQAQSQVIIIVNKNTLDESLIRRCSLVLTFGKLDQLARQRMLTNTFRAHGVEDLFSHKEISLLAEHPDLSQGMVGLAIRDSLNMGQDHETQKDLFLKLINSRTRYLSGSGVSLTEKEDRYDPEIINTSLSVPEIEEKLNYFYDPEVKRWKPKQLTFLFHGPSGTGKTAFAQHLAKKMKRNLISLSAGSLQDKYVGGTEERIRSMFQTAEKEQSILFLDELDSLLRGRSPDDKRYEVSQVNEFLQSLEGFKGVFIGATNFSNSLDQALDRRFSDKVEFYLPDSRGRRKLLKNYFSDQVKMDDCFLEEIAQNMKGLTPGHVKAVKQSLAHKEFIPIDVLVNELKKVVGKTPTRLGFLQ